MNVMPIKRPTAQVRDRLLDLIKSGDIDPDGRLPTERALADRFGVGRRFVRQALDALEAEGLVGARYLEVRLLLENNALSNEETIAWEPFTRN